MRILTGTVLAGLLLAALAAGCGGTPSTPAAGEENVDVHSGGGKGSAKGMPKPPRPPDPPP